MAPVRCSRRLSGLALASLLLMAGCGRASEPSASAKARDELRRAVERTLAASSFVMRADVPDGPNSVEDASIVYQAPDRVRRPLGVGVVEIAIGHTLYHSGLPVPPNVVVSGDRANGLVPPTVPAGTFWRTELPATGPRQVDGLLAELRILAEADRVRRTGGSSYTWGSGTGDAAVSGDATVEDGRVVRYTFAPQHPDYKGVATAYRIGDFDRAPPVEAPPADKVIDQPLPEPCGPDGMPKPGQTICTPDRMPDFGKPPTLPAPSGKRSTLQLRPVQNADASDCGPSSENPPADRPALVSGRDGRCYDLGPAALTVDRADARAESDPAGVAVLLQLDPADTATLTRILSAQVGRQVAMVMFGAVQSAPVVHDPGEGEGALVITPLDPQTAADAMGSLNR